MPLPGKLMLKGGVSLKPGGAGVKKKKKKSTGDDAGAGSSGAAADSSAAPDEEKPEKKLTYEEEFVFETERVKEGKARSTPWGTSYRKPPAVLHGYDKEVKGVNPSERLDLRCAVKADRMCK